MMNTAHKKIALCVSLEDSYERAIARGVIRYAREHPDWRLYGYGWMFLSLADLRSWRGDGIIARLKADDEMRDITSLNLPVVDVAGGYLDRGCHQVGNDDYETGVKAGKYLLSCGYRHLAYCGVPEWGWSEKRETGFRATVREVCPDVRRFHQSYDWWHAYDRFEGLEDWMRGLEFPAGIFACNDIAGVKLTKMCERLGIKVPEEVAILGVDNEDLLCELASPTLSSIPLDCEGIGYRAAGILDEVIDDPTARPDRPVTLLPMGEPVERESTRMFVCADPLIGRAVRFIRAHATDGIHVSDLVKHLDVSRRNLEVRFKREIGMTIHEEIIRLRLLRAKILLKTSDRKISEIVEESGFGTLQSFYSVFREAEGLTPAQYRKQQRQI